ncbi:LOW QUALITY PROTEIN: hypothetical protein HID58_080406 [Brassica napus]|uniref:Hyaluronan/mRNA-binding protein domain-containing protein n=4 Tax=Brassica TaxID=3705 RepID=A0ABQ7Y4S2_BRANA|nr:LOW QUALITY PROTEIN: hypothetical protein HID58_080406 [Brassica napus]
MATLNPFDLLGDDAEDPSQIAVSIAADKPKKPVPVSAVSAKSSAPSRQLPQPVREARNDAPRGGGRGGGDRGSSRGGYNRDFRGGDGNSGGYNKPSEEGGGGGSKPFYEKRSVPGVYGGAPRGGRRGEAGEGERPRRTYERRSGTGRGGDFKREGAGRGNWGTPGEEVLVYEKILEEKKKSLQSQTTSERKVDTKVFESMQQLSNKKSNDEIFIKLGSDKDKRKDDKEEKAKKAVSINEFLKPAEGENHYRGGGSGGGRGRGRGGRDRGGVSGGVFDGYRSEAAPAIGDTDQFPSLGGKSNLGYSCGLLQFSSSRLKCFMLSVCWSVVVSWNAMISGYGNLEMASGFFQTALVRGVCESVIITRYMKGNKVKLAEVFKDMTVKTNLVTWNASVMPEIFSARRWTETIQSNARGRHLVLTRLDWAVYCSDAAIAFKERKMRRSASGSRVSDQFSQAKPSHSRSMSRSQSVRLVEDAELHLPRYDPSSQSGKREEKSRSRSAENVVHFIPLLLVLCVIILWLFSRSGKPFVLGLIGSM